MPIVYQILYALFFTKDNAFKIVDLRRDRAMIIEVYNKINLPYLHLIIGGSKRRVYRVQMNTKSK